MGVLRGGGVKGILYRVSDTKGILCGEGFLSMVYCIMLRIPRVV